MKSIISIFSACVLVAFSTCAQNSTTSVPNVEDAAATSKRVSILGDSYSTFEGFIPEGYIAWYKPVPKEGRPTDVTRPEQTWWQIYIDRHGFELEANDSYSGATVCNTGYGGSDYSDRSFATRVGRLGNPDIIFLFGGTNDAWAEAPLGDYIWSGWTDADLYSYRPAAAYVVSNLKERYPEAEVLVIINDEISEDVKESTVMVAEHYGVGYVQLHDIEKMSLHPDSRGMVQIADQIDNALAR